MDIITAQAFRRLRLKDYFPDSEIALFSDWEFEDRLWVCESIGFTQWLRPHDAPEDTEYISLELETLPKRQVRHVIDQLKLDIEPGVEIKKVKDQFGEPSKEYVFTPNRKTFEFEVGEVDRFILSFTLLNDGGLTYFGMMLGQV